MAADWWWVSGDPEDAAIMFVDAASLAEGKARAVSVDRSSFSGVIAVREENVRSAAFLPPN
jgi:hypothetical protein